MTTNIIGKRLKDTRKLRKLTQAQLALKAGVSQGTIGNIESGLRGYGESLVDIANALEVSPEYLRAETEIPSAANDAHTSDGGNLSERQKAILTLFDGLTKKQQDEFFKNLEDQKQANSELIAELSERRHTK